MDRLRRPFTLVELLVVIAIISILAGMLLPALRKARVSAITTSCLNNQKQLVIGVRLYTDTWDSFYPMAIMHPTRAPAYKRSWLYMAKDIAELKAARSCPGLDTSFYGVNLSELEEGDDIPGYTWLSGSGYKYDPTAGNATQRATAPYKAMYRGLRDSQVVKPSTKLHALDASTRIGYDKSVSGTPAGLSVYYFNNIWRDPVNYPTQFLTEVTTKFATPLVSCHDGLVNCMFLDGHAESIKHLSMGTRRLGFWPTEALEP